MHSRRISSDRLCDRIRMTWRIYSGTRVHTHISLVPSRSWGRGCWLSAREKYDPLVNETREKGERERETRVARRQLPAETAIGIARGGKWEREALAGRRRGRSGGWSTERGKRTTEKADWGFWWSNEEATTEGKSVTTLAEREGEKDDNRKSMRSRARITGSTRCTFVWAYMRAHTATRRGQEDWLLINRRKYSRTPACEKERDYHAESMYIGEDFLVARDVPVSDSVSSHLRDFSVSRGARRATNTPHGEDSTNGTSMTSRRSVRSWGIRRFGFDSLLGEGDRVGRLESWCVGNAGFEDEEFEIGKRVVKFLEM